MRGLIESDMHKTNEATEDFNKALQLDPTNAEAFRGFAHLLINGKKYEEAIEKINRAIELKPTSSAYNNRGFAYLELGNYTAALPDLQKAISLSPTSPRRMRIWDDCIRTRANR